MSQGPDYMQAALALALVLGLLLVVAAALSRWKGRLPGAGSGHRLTVIETRSLDPRHRLVLVRWDRSEHLLVIGQGAAQLVASGSAAAVVPTADAGGTA
jgi:flagellar protein FliO/FliZ